MQIPEMQQKIQKISFDFEIIAFEFWMRQTLVFTERENLSSAVNMSTKCLKISDTTKTEHFEVISFQSDQKM